MATLQALLLKFLRAILPLLLTSLKQWLGTLALASMVCGAVD